MNTTRARTDLDWPEWLPALPDPDAPDARITALIIVGALVLSGGLIWLALGDWVPLMLFAAGLVGLASLIMVYRRQFPARVQVQAALPDWSVTHAATDHPVIAIAITDEAGRMICANQRFVDLQPALRRHVHTGMHFSEYLDHLADSGSALEALGQPVPWREQRSSLHRDCNGSYLEPLSDGRCLDHRLRAGRAGGCARCGRLSCQRHRLAGVDRRQKAPQADAGAALLIATSCT